VLVQATSGDFYGTTASGGLNGMSGAVFKITPSGTLTTPHSFAGYPTDGSRPCAGLVHATDGNLYGTTSKGGANAGGTVFQMTPSGRLATLYSFCAQSGCMDGDSPVAGLIQATDGNLYGTTQDGGANGSGTMFQMTPSGTLTTLYSFCSQSGCTDGAYPKAGLVQDTNGTFYGTTVGGGGRRGRHGIQPVCRSGPLCGNTTYLRRCGIGRRHSGERSDRRDQRQL